MHKQLTAWCDVISVTEMKGNKVYLYSAIYMYSLCIYLKALRHGPHSFTCKLHHACVSFVNVHQMTPPLSLLLIYRPRRDEGMKGMPGT